ncbi:hypothetical protein BDB01DRAFT_853077 [Pilobolus umbonatus]|nr:hypothetical protein BDB01DRAFT_853077 [Pilobolus umbonatus]
MNKMPIPEKKTTHIYICAYEKGTMTSRTGNMHRDATISPTYYLDDGSKAYKGSDAGHKMSNTHDDSSRVFSSHHDSCECEGSGIGCQCRASCEC